MILIGSKALRFWFPDFPREPKDTDYAVNKVLKPFKSEKGVEHLVNEVLWEYYDEPYGKDVICDPDTLYTLKMSHWKRVYHFTDHDVYIQVSGYYQSHHGTDFDNGWNDVKEVKPVEKTITVYN